MEGTVHAALEAQFASHEIVRKLHDVPPHGVYKVVVDGRRAVYKGDAGPAGSAGIEGRVMAFVGEETSIPVAEVLDVGDRHFVAAWHPHAPAPEATPAADVAWARAAGRCLATLHEETAPVIDGYGRFRPDGDGIAGPRFESWQGAAIEYLSRRSAALTRYGHGDGAEGVADWLRDHPAVFDGADGPVCCHGWATPEHVAIRGGRVACMIDFEHALAAPAEFDYWRTVIPTFGPADGPAKRAFREGYEGVRSLPAGIQRRRPVYAMLNEVYYLESLFVQNRHEPEETQARATWLRERIIRRLEELS